jgi:hypothetical protein
MLDINVRSDFGRLARSLNDLERRQLPFATAQALTGIGRHVRVAEQTGMRRKLDRPMPFTINSVGVKAARKSDLTAIVYMRDIAASYLEPFEFGGNHKLIGSGRTWLNPKNGLSLNQYGNLTRNKLKQLKARPDIFIGKVKTKNGDVIDGVWQRPHAKPGQAARRTTRTGIQANTSGHLKLLLRFGDAIPVRQHLGWRDRAKAVVAVRSAAEWRRALAAAVRTAR